MGKEGVAPYDFMHQFQNHVILTSFLPKLVYKTLSGATDGIVNKHHQKAISFLLFGTIHFEYIW